MISIEKSKRQGEFFVRTESTGNSKKLENAETFTQKKNCWVHIKAMFKTWNSAGVEIEDNTGRITKFYWCYLKDGKFIKQFMPTKSVETNIVL